MHMQDMLKDPRSAPGLRLKKYNLKYFYCVQDPVKRHWKVSLKENFVS